MSTHDDDRRRFEANKSRLAESERQIAHLHGRMQGYFEALPRDEAAITEIMRETGAPRELVVQRLEALAERELTALHEAAPSPGPAEEDADDPAVKRFREMLS